MYESGNVIMQTHHLSTVPCHELLGSGLCPLTGEPPVRWRGVLDLKSPASHPRTLPLPFQPGFLTPSPQTNGKSRFYVVLRTISDNSVCVVGDRPKFLIPMSLPAGDWGLHVVTFLLPLMAATQADINIACFSNLERYTEVLPLALLLQGRCVAQMGHRLLDSVLNNTFGLRLVQRSCSMMSSRTGAAPAHRSIVPCHGKSTVPAAKCGKRPRDRGARSWHQVPHPFPETATHAATATSVGKTYPRQPHPASRNGPEYCISLLRNHVPGQNPTIKKGWHITPNDICVQGLFPSQQLS